MFGSNRRDTSIIFRTHCDYRYLHLDHKIGASPSVGAIAGIVGGAQWYVAGVLAVDSKFNSPSRAFYRLSENKKKYPAARTYAVLCTKT